MVGSSIFLLAATNTAIHSVDIVSIEFMFALMALNVVTLVFADRRVVKMACEALMVIQMAQYSLRI